MSEPLLRIRNHHSPECGDPPIVDSDDPPIYIGYFANAHGEQWIFTYHRETKKAELRGGDVGWNNPFEVRDGKVEEVALAPDETIWFEACWRAATGGR
jgi:hypothetical protein